MSTDPGANVIPLRDRLRSALTAAMKRRDRCAAGALRSALGAIDNAEAVDTSERATNTAESSLVPHRSEQAAGTAGSSHVLDRSERAIDAVETSLVPERSERTVDTREPSLVPEQGGAKAGAIESSAVGLGVAEVRRRELTEADIERIVRIEIDERRSTAVEYESLGRADRAADLRAEADVLTEQLGTR